MCVASLVLYACGTSNGVRSPQQQQCPTRPGAPAQRVSWRTAARCEVRTCRPGPDAQSTGACVRHHGAGVLPTRRFSAAPSTSYCRRHAGFSVNTKTRTSYGHQHQHQRTCSQTLTFERGELAAAPRWPLDSSGCVSAPAVQRRGTSVRLGPTTTALSACATACSVAPLDLRSWACCAFGSVPVSAQRGGPAGGA
jgi:hypothetical protein